MLLPELRAPSASPPVRGGARGLVRFLPIALLTVLPACSRTPILDYAPPAQVVAEASPIDSGHEAAAAFGDASVILGHLHLTRDGAFVDPKVTQAAAAGLTLDTAFNGTYTGQTYAQPLFVDGLKPGQDAVFVVTQANNVVALDATTGSTLWSVTLGAPVSPAVLPCHQPITEPYGILSTPVIDPESRTLFTEAFIAEGDDGVILRHLVYALSIDDGSTRAGWPVDIGASVDGFVSMVQHQRGALMILDGTLYLPYSGIEFDCGMPPYHGRVIGISLADPTTITSWATPAIRGGIWGGLASDGTSLFFATGNTGPDAGTWGGGEAVIRLPPSLAFAGDTTSYFTPSDWPFLDLRDYDLGSSTLVLFDLPGATPSSLAVAMGKRGTVHLVDRANLGGLGTGNGLEGEGLFSAAVAPAAINGNPATYQTAKGRYVVLRADANATGCPTGTSGDLVALKIAAASPPTFSVAWCATSHGLGSPMVTTTDGTANPVVWVVSAQRTNLLYGFDGDTGAPLYTGGGEPMTTVLRWTNPIVAKGRFYVGATNKMYAFNAP